MHDLQIEDLSTLLYFLKVQWSLQEYQKKNKYANNIYYYYLLFIKPIEVGDG